MRYRRLGRTGLEVSEVGFGGGGIGSVWGPTTDREAIEAVHRARDLGINFFDVAPDYGGGQAEAVLGRALEGARHEVLVATKVHLPPDRLDDIRGYVRESVTASLARLRTDYLDLLQIHNSVSLYRRRPLPSTLTAEDALAMAAAFQELQRGGVVRYLGFTAWRIHGTLLDRLLASGLFDALQTEYNLVNQTAEIPPPPGADVLGDAAMETLAELPPLSLRYRRVDQGRAIPKAWARDVGVIAIRPYLAGFLTDALDRPEEPSGPMQALRRLTDTLRFLTAGGTRPLSGAALRFCLTNPRIATVVPGAKNAAEIEEAATWAEASPLTQEELLWIEALYRQDFRVSHGGAAG